MRALHVRELARQEEAREARCRAQFEQLEKAASRAIQVPNLEERRRRLGPPAAAAAVANRQAPTPNGKEQAAATPGTGTGTGQTTLGANGKETFAPAGTSGQTIDAAVLQALGRIEEQIGRLEQKQALLLEAQEGHYEDVEELEGTVEEIAEAETNILDSLEAGSQQARTTMENVAAAAKAARDTSLVLAAFGGLALLLWVLSWKVLGVAPAKVSSPTPKPEEESAPAKTPSTVPTPAKVGIREME